MKNNNFGEDAADGAVPENTGRSRRRKGNVRTGQKITLSEVAKLAGVSPITVSRAVNQPSLVTAKTLRRVQDVIERTGYVPNLVAGALASQRSRLVAAIVPTIGNSIFAEAIEALTETLDAAGYKVLLGFSGYPTSMEDDLVTTVLSRQPDAIFLTGIDHSPVIRKRLLAAAIPVVETWDMTSTPIDMLVGFSHEKLGRAVAIYLHDKGYRRIGMLWATDDRAKVRQRAFLETLGEYGIHDVRIVSVEAPGTFPKGREGFASLMEGEVPEAIFCSSDSLAHGALTEAQARGLAVPEEVAFIGFGDLDFAAKTCPALSTVAIDRLAIGHLAADLILKRIAGEPVESIADIGFSIVERETT